jgi:hypothetical protein
MVHGWVCREVTEQELAEVVLRVDRAEACGEIGPWEQSDAHTSVIPAGKEPQPGEIIARREWPDIGATELILGNGMKVLCLPHQSLIHPGVR